MIRSEFRVSRPCHNCNGTGEGKCLVKCHVCNGDKRRTFKLYASDLEGVTLTTYARPPIDVTDPSIRVAPRFVEGERRTFLTAVEAHEAAAMMLAYGEIVSYTVTGWDDFAQLSTEDRERAWAELAALDAAKVAARAASVEHVNEAEGVAVVVPEGLGDDWLAWDKYLARLEREERKAATPDAWENEDCILADLRRIGCIQDGPNGPPILTEKGVAKLKAALQADADEVPWVRQLTKLAQKQTFLADKAAQ